MYSKPLQIRSPWLPSALLWTLVQKIPTTPKEPLEKVAELLNKKHKRKDKNIPAWFCDPISKQPISDLLQDEGRVVNDEYQSPQYSQWMFSCLYYQHILKYEPQPGWYQDEGRIENFVLRRMWSQQDRDGCWLSDMSSLLSWLAVLSAVPILCGAC